MRISVWKRTAAVFVDNDIARTILSRSLAPFGPLLGYPRLGAEMALRGLTHLRIAGGKGLYVGRYVVFAGESRISCGEHVRLYGFNYLNAEGRLGQIHIGDQSHVDQGSVLYGQGGITIGPGCAIAAGVKIYSQSNQYRADPMLPVFKQPVLYKPVIIGANVWIGANAVLLPGVEIGEGAVIGAGAIVKGKVPAFAILAGNPAKIIGQRTTEQDTTCVFSS